jgi:hypothetical protein
MFVVVAGQVVAESLLGDSVARTLSGGVVCRGGKRKFSEPKRGNQKRMLADLAASSCHIHTLLHTRLLLSPFKNDARVSQPQNISSQDVDPISRLFGMSVSSLSTLPSLSVLQPLQQSHCDIALGYTFSVVGSIGEYPRRPLV